MFDSAFRTTLITGAAAAVMITATASAQSTTTVSGTVLPAAVLSTETTRAAPAFVDSVAVNVHSNYEGTPYSDGGGWTNSGRDSVAYTRTIQTLASIGIRTIRDGDEGRQDQRNFWTRAFNEAGVRSIPIEDPRNDGPALVSKSSAQPYADAISNMRWRLALLPAIPGIRALDGPNEANTIAGARGDWQINDTEAQFLVDFMRELKTEAASRLPGKPVFAWSPTNWQSAWQTNEHGLSALNLPYNLHPYAPGTSPAPWPWETGPIVDNYNNFVQRFEGADIYSGRPFVVTEDGYHTSLTDTSTGFKGVSEQVQAAYTERMLLESFFFQAWNPAPGGPLTAIYELFDQTTNPDWHQDNFGLANPDYSLKPSGRRVKNLLAALTRPGTATPAQFSYAIDAIDGSPGWQHVRYFSLSRADGKKVIAAWRPDSLWDTTTMTPTPVAPVSLRFSFADTLRDVEIIETAAGSSPVRTCRASSGSVVHPVRANSVTLVVVKPRASRNPGAC